MHTDEQIVEIGARALFGDRWDDLAPMGQINMRRSMGNVLAALREAGLVVEQGWRFDMENAPVDEPLILATTGGHVGEAIRDIGNDDGSWSFRWAHTFGPLHPKLKPIAFRPLPTPPGTGGET